MLIEIHPQNPQSKRILEIVKILEGGGIVAYPTDTIYGIGCDIYSKKGLEKIQQIKGRDKNKPLSFICSDLAHISQFAKVPNYAYRIMKRLLPGPYTFILDASSEVPRMLMPKRKTVGIRVPDNAIVLSIVKELGHPLITTSANFSGEDVISDPFEIERIMGKQLDAVINGGRLSGEPSTVIDLTGNAPEIIRKGAGDYSWIEE